MYLHKIIAPTYAENIANLFTSLESYQAIYHLVSSLVVTEELYPRESFTMTSLKYLWKQEFETNLILFHFFILLLKSKCDTPLLPCINDLDTKAKPTFRPPTYTPTWTLQGLSI